MSLPALSDSTFNPREPISGYFTRELIGRGGFGEVWKAEAPGGLSKAIKIVHAGIDSNRAERELRALQRIKDVRHPLILSIERIEIIAGTLVIVTELADSSLRDLFKKSREKGLPGVPKERLVSLLRDAADALDYIYEEHSLQHLDIKPENLLVVGNRLKLGDFGLLKNIYERGASLVSGLTPTYAPPELFEGKPTRQSDQYSLAIVYQHMLTGELPYEGATAAQLAREHLAGVPRLTLLSRTERPIIARALSKVPGERFTSCAELISSLVAAPPDPPEPTDPVSSAAPNTPVAFRTQTVSVDIPSPQSGKIALAQPPGTDPGNINPGRDLRATAPDQVLGALEAGLRPTCRSGDSSTRRSSAIPGSGFAPTLFIGIGATGGFVLQELRRRLSDSFGVLENVPAFQMMLLDTDGKQMNALLRDKHDWSDVEVVALPLRRPEDYGFRESGLNKWLHRRWLYNMPRSLSTEGYRPLGRLALVDHGKRAIVSIRTALAKAASAENVSKSAATTGLPFQQGHVRVVFVAAISGATGGGMLLDLAYCVRGELKKRGCSDEDVLAVLLHAAPHAAADRDKAIANSYATLSELGHYSSPGRYYPGERAIESPSFHGDNRTFGGVYVVNVPTAVDGSEWSAAAAQVSEYLFCTAATPAKRVVDAARCADEELPVKNPSTVLIRSLNVCRLDCSDSSDAAECIQQACRDVITLWQSGTPAPDVSDSAPAADSAALLDLAEDSAEPQVDPQVVRVRDWLTEAGLDVVSLPGMARGIVEQVWGENERDFVRRLFLQHCQSEHGRHSSRRQLVEAAEQIMDRLLGDSSEEHRVGPQRTVLREHLRDQLAERALALGQGLVARIRALVDDPDTGVQAARSVTDAVTVQLKNLRNELGQLRQSLRNSVSQQVRNISIEPPPQRRSRFAWFRRRKCTEEMRPEPADELADYAVGRLEEARLAALQQFLDHVEAPVSDLFEQLNHLAHDLHALEKEFHDCTLDREHGAAGRAAGPAARSFAQRIREALLNNRVQIARAVAEEFNQTILAGAQKLQRYIGLHAQLQHTLAAPLRRVARQVVLGQIRQTTQLLIEESAREAAEGLESACSMLVSEFVEERRATSLTPQERLIVLVPESVDPRQLQEAFTGSKSATLIPARTNGITICWERGPQPLENVADEIVQQQELYRQLAEKLHTREDVDWGPLAQPRPQAKETRRDEVAVQASVSAP